MILVAYASKYGTTKEVAEHIASTLNDRGEAATARPAGKITDLGGDVLTVIIGSPIYNGDWLPDATSFIENNAGTLSTISTWLFSVGPLGPDHTGAQKVDLTFVSELVSPHDTAVFYGALNQTDLDAADRTRAASEAMPSGDFRDWDAITAFAETIIAEQGGKPGRQTMGSTRTKRR